MPPRYLLPMIALVVAIDLLRLWRKHERREPSFTDGVRSEITRGRLLASSAFLLLLSIASVHAWLTPR